MISMTVAPFIMQQIWVPRPSTMTLPAAVGTGTPLNSAALFPNFIPSPTHAESWQSSGHLRSTFWLGPKAERYLTGVLAETTSERVVFGVTFYAGVHDQLHTAISAHFGMPRTYHWAGELHIVNPAAHAALGRINEVNETAGSLHQTHPISIRALRGKHRAELPVPIAEGTTFFAFNESARHLETSLNSLDGNARHFVGTFLHSWLLTSSTERTRRSLGRSTETDLRDTALRDKGGPFAFSLMERAIVDLLPDQQSAVDVVSALYRRYRTTAQGAAPLTADEREQLFTKMDWFVALYQMTFMDTPPYELFVLNPEANPSPAR